MIQRLTLANVSILGAVIAYLLPIGIVKYRAAKAFDNSKPRDETFFKDPFRARGLWAHHNGIEGFAFFAAAVVVAEMKGAAQPVADALALAYVALRLAYAAAYLGDKPKLRSAVWTVAFAVNVALLLSPTFA
jgi:uncharacterized MAPEG superfamily protein